MSRPIHPADVATGIVGAASVGIGLMIVVAGPTDPMPIHWGWEGHADDWAGRETLGATIAGLGALILVFAGGFGVAARRVAEPAAARALRLGQWLVLIILTVLNALPAAASLGGVEKLHGAAPAAIISLVFALIGAVLGRVGPNLVLGVRTPWSYKSRQAWDRSNRLAGRLLLLIGAGGLAASPFLAHALGLAALLIAGSCALAWSTFESWRVWRSDPDRRPF